MILPASDKAMRIKIWPVCPSQEAAEPGKARSEDGAEHGHHGQIVILKFPVEIYKAERRKLIF